MKLQSLKMMQYKKKWVMRKRTMRMMRTLIFLMIY